MDPLLIVNGCFYEGHHGILAADSTLVIFIAGGVLLLISIFMVLINKWLQNVNIKAMEEMNELYPGEVILHQDGANFFGRKSLGFGQVRGNGLLILTEKKLLFRQAAPSRWFEIPIDRITGIQNPRSFMGKGFAGGLLVVNYFNEEGESDAIGWAVRDYRNWNNLLESAREELDYF